MFYFIKDISQFCCLWALPWKSYPLQRLPTNQGLSFRVAEESFFAGGGEEKRMRQEKMHLSDSWIQGNLPTCSSVCPGFSQQCWWALQEWERDGSVHRPLEARIPQLQTHLGSLSRFIPSPTSLWGKFLQDASCFSLNPLSSLNSIKLGTMKASNDLLIEIFFSWNYSILAVSILQPCQHLNFLAEVFQHSGKWCWVLPTSCITREVLTQFQAGFSLPDL